VYSLDEKTWSAVLLTGSGTAAVEAMLTSLVPRRVAGETASGVTDHAFKSCVTG
jgi:hypothetical protein